MPAGSDSGFERAIWIRSALSSAARSTESSTPSMSVTSYSAISGNWDAARSPGEHVPCRSTLVVPSSPAGQPPLKKSYSQSVSSPLRKSSTHREALPAGLTAVQQCCACSLVNGSAALLKKRGIRLRRLGCITASVPFQVPKQKEKLKLGQRAVIVAVVVLKSRRRRIVDRLFAGRKRLRSHGLFWLRRWTTKQWGDQFRPTPVTCSLHQQQRPTCVGMSGSKGSKGSRCAMCVIPRPYTLIVNVC